ncbi:S8 family peptidase [Anaerotignum sp.]|nr:S8 family serine peptidase [Anaerotignum sp.]MBQ7758640.1 S8 family serine peptidase [Anaerotignum sp.]
MKLKGLLLATAVCFLPTMPVFAQEESGYLVKLKPTAAVTIEHEDGYVLDQMEYMPQYCRVASMEDVETYIGMENVESIEPRRKLELFDMPNDPYYDAQWGYTAMQTEYARLAGITGKGVKVAVIDSGIYADHEEFTDADIDAGRNFARVSETDHTVNADDVTDYIGHGTAVTSVIAASTDNELGGCGIAPDVTIIPMRCFSLTEAYDDWAAEAIYAAVNEYDCDIINMSFGEGRPSTVFTEAVEYAYEQGVIMVAAVGNYGSSTELYPAAFDEVIGVGAVGAKKEWCDFSQYNESVFITAPGDLMVTAEKTASDAYRTNRDGTSFSSPCIAAVAALALQADDALTPEAFCDLLKETAEDLGDSGYDVYYGYGLIDIEQVLKKLGVTLEDVTAKKKGSNTKISGFIEGYGAGEATQDALAGFDETERMIAFSFQKLTADKIGVVDVQEVFEKDYTSFAKIRLFWVQEDGQMSPADTPKQIEIQ